MPGSSVRSVSATVTSVRAVRLRKAPVVTTSGAMSFGSSRPFTADVESSIALGVGNPPVRPSSGIWMSLMSLLLLLASADSKVFKACEVASEVLRMTIQLYEVTEKVNCSPADVARLVCIASLHDFNTSYVGRMADGDEALGLFGVPSKDVKESLDLRNSDNFADHFYSLTRSQFRRNTRGKSISLVSEMLCDEAELTLKFYVRILELWNMREFQSKTSWLYKRRVKCTELHLDSLYIMKEELRRIYRPGLLNRAFTTASVDENKEDSFDAFDKSCREVSYCMNSCSSKEAEGDENTHSGTTLPSSGEDVEDAEFRKHRGRMERKVERYGKVADFAIVAIWILAVTAALVAVYVFIRNPRRRGARSDDWSRPIVTARFSEHR